MTDVANLLVAVALIVLAAVIYRAVAPARTRITVMPAELTPVDEEAFLADLTAHLTAYGEAVADYYDTTPGDR
ncbi:hypothetical protein [Streptomyces sp. NPDC086182]|uniref:hypothetical protein n=1 Tax=Streptomyces sp. NPDC086182 TaxID=3155058 RepID=UPI0034232437